MPVITPWELELGLGAREWSSCYQQDATSILDGDIETAIENVKRSLPEDPIDSDAESSSCTGDNLNLNENGEGYEDQGEYPEESDRNLDHNHRHTHTHTPQLSLVKKSEDRIAIAAGIDPTLEHFRSRTFQGLEPTVPVDQDTSIQQGLFGIAAGYSQKKEIEEEEEGEEKEKGKGKEKG